MAPAPISVTANGCDCNMANTRYVGFFGDSRAYLSFTSNGLHAQLRNVGLAHWLQAYGDNAFSLLGELNGGIAGDTTGGMLARQPAFIELLKSRACTLAVFIGSTNDRTNNTDLGVSQKNVREIVRNFLQAGIAVIAISETPRGDGCSQYELATQQQKGDHYRMHRWFEEKLSSMCTVLNVWDRMIDSESGSNYYVKPGMTEDGIHMSKIGAQQVGVVGGPVIAGQVRHLGDYLLSNERYHGGNPLGTLSANPLLAGTDGVFEGFTPVEGSRLASEWKASSNNADGLTFTFSQETDERGARWQKIHARGQVGGSGASLHIATSLAVENLSEGDRVKATARVKSAGEGLSNLALMLLMTPAWKTKGDPEDSTKACPWPSEAIGPLSRETPMYRHVAPDHQTGLEPRIEVDFAANAAVDASVWFSQCGAFKFTY
jgi:lysophospholipase L1-like esterase